jgi:hypothetical protein
VIKEVDKRIVMEDRFLYDERKEKIQKNLTLTLTIGRWWSFTADRPRGLARTVARGRDDFRVS